jgi:hypothetical protein
VRRADLPAEEGRLRDREGRDRVAQQPGRVVVGFAVVWCLEALIYAADLPLQLDQLFRAAADIEEVRNRGTSDRNDGYECL